MRSRCHPFPSRHGPDPAVEEESKLMRGFVASPATVLFRSGFHRTPEVTPLFRKLFRFPLPFLQHLGPLTTAHGTKIFAHSCACYYLLLLMSHQGFPSVPSPLFPCAPLSAVLMSSTQNFLFGRTLLHPCKTFMDSFEVAHVHISVHLVYGRKLLLSVNNQSKVDDHI